MTDPYVLTHHGFSLRIGSAATPDGPRHAFAVLQEGQQLHASGRAYRSLVAAERAARCFVDDALRAFQVASAADARLYSSSK